MKYQWRNQQMKVLRQNEILTDEFQDTEVFPFSPFEKTYGDATEQPYREHVTPYIYKKTRFLIDCILSAR